MKKQAQLSSKYGIIRLLKKNPRTIRPDAFEKLCESIQRDPDFMIANPIKVDETNTVLGGNQRYRALQALGYTSIPDDWIRRVAHADGSPFTAEEKERLVYIDNSPEGISGDFDYQMMAQGTSLELLRDVGIDLAKIEVPDVERVDFETKAAAQVEEGEIGEKSETLKDLDRKRADSLAKFEDMGDCGFYSVLVFQSTKQREAFAAWCEANGVRGKYKGRFVNGEEFAAACKIEVPKDDGAKIRERLPNAVLESMTLHEKDDAEL